MRNTSYGSKAKANSQEQLTAFAFEHRLLPERCDAMIGNVPPEYWDVHYGFVVDWGILEDTEMGDKTAWIMWHNIDHTAETTLVWLLDS